MPSVLPPRDNARATPVTKAAGDRLWHIGPDEGGGLCACPCQGAWDHQYEQPRSPACNVPARAAVALRLQQRRTRQGVAYGTTNSSRPSARFLDWMRVTCRITLLLRTGRHHWVHTSNSDTWIQRKSPVPLDRCGAALALDLLPDRGTRMVVRSLGHGVRRFADSMAVIGI